MPVPRKYEFTYGPLYNQDDWEVVSDRTVPRGIGGVGGNDLEVNGQRVAICKSELHARTIAEALDTLYNGGEKK